MAKAKTRQRGNKKAGKKSPAKKTSAKETNTEPAGDVFVVQVRENHRWASGPRPWDRLRAVRTDDTMEGARRNLDAYFEKVKRQKQKNRSAGGYGYSTSGDREYRIATYRQKSATAPIKMKGEK